jgi:hypothetical protein
MSQSAPQIPGNEIKKKGLSTLAWVGMGCGGIVLIGIVCVALVGYWGYSKFQSVTTGLGKKRAELVLQMSSDLEKVSENEATGEMTVRVKSTNEQITMKYDDLVKGQFPKFAKGDLAKVPSWVPRYPAAMDEASALQSDDASKVSGVITFTIADSTKTIENFYDEETRKLSLDRSVSSSISVNGTDNLNMEYHGGNRSMTISVSGKSGEPRNVLVAYTEKK